MKSKKGQLGDLGKLAVGIAGLAIVLVVTFLILSQAKSQIVTTDGVDTTNESTWSLSYNATNELTDAVATVPGWVPLIVIAMIGAVLLGLVAKFRG